MLFSATAHTAKWNKNEEKLKVELQQVFYLQIEIYLWVMRAGVIVQPCPCSYILFIEVWEILCNVTSLVKQRGTKGEKTTKFNNYTNDLQ